MEAIRRTVVNITLQHLTLILVCALIIYLLRAHDSYHVIARWRKDLDPDFYKNEKYPSAEEKVPHPIITDLEADGINEIVVVTTDIRLQVLVLPSWEVQPRNLPSLAVKYSVSLPRNYDENGQVGHPVTVEAGYLAAYDAQSPNRTQIIVVVMTDWRVLCYDHTLTLLWERKLMDTGQMHEHYIIKSMAALVTSYKLHPKDHGIVVVGGSFGHKNHESRRRMLKVNTQKPMMQQAGEKLQEQPVDPYTHFSTFAMDAATGTVRWHHLPGDFQVQNEKEEEEFHHWKLSLMQQQRHIGEVHWSKYSSNLLRLLPHHWSDLKDTRMEVAVVRKLGKGEEPAKSDTNSLVDILGFDRQHLEGVAFGGLPPHSHHEHVKNPNVIVVFHHDGLEMLDIHSGRPLTRVKLQEKQSLYVDVDDDGTVEQVKSDLAGRCQAEVSVLYPRPRTIFVGPLCDSPSWFQSMTSDSTSSSAGKDGLKNTGRPVPPIAVKSIAKKSGFVSHLLGHTLLSQRKGYDSIFLISTGRMTSYGPKGEFSWQVMTPAQWSSIVESPRGQENLDDTYNIYEQVFKPSLVPVSLKIFGQKTAALATGWDTMALVDLRNGYILAEHTLPCQQMDAPVLADFSGDGWTDIIISCPTAYVGFTVHKNPNYLYHIVMAIAVILTVLLLSWCCQPNKDDIDMEFQDD